MCMTIKDKYIDPFTDFGFKHIFGTDKNKRFLISFLNGLLDLEDKIVDLEYRSLEKLGLKINDRRAIFDVYCTDKKNNNFIVELQRSEQTYFKDRSIYYTTFPIQEQAKKGSWDYELTKVYFVGILEFAFDDMRLKKNKEDNKYLSKVKLFDCDEKVLFYDKLTYYYLEMPKFRKKEKELSNKLDQWLFYLNNLHSSKKIPEALKNEEIFQEAYEVAEFIALDKNDQFRYQQDLKARWDNKACLDFAQDKGMRQGLEKGLKKGLEQGLEQGLEKGLEKGLEQGLEQGLEKGLEQGIEKGLERGVKQEKIKILKASLKKGLDVETILAITGLTIQEIEQIKKDIDKLS